MDRIQEKQAIETKLARCRESGERVPTRLPGADDPRYGRRIPPANPRTRKAVGPPRLAATFFVPDLVRRLSGTFETCPPMSLTGGDRKSQRSGQTDAFDP